MTLTTFQKQCKPGIRVHNKPKGKDGLVVKISRDRSKALVQYENGSVEWNDYYLLDFITPKEQ